MKACFKITSRLLVQVREDLRRRHAFAFERVGFITCRFAESPTGLLILAHNYYPVADDDYVETRRYGALIGSGAFRMAFQLALNNNVGIFHVHLHEHRGQPSPSRIDFRETKQFVPDFFHVRPQLPHGAVILSNDSMSGRYWDSHSLQPQLINEFVIVGAPLERVRVRK